MNSDMNPGQEVTGLRKSGRLEEASKRGYELLKDNPEDSFLLSSIGWVIYAKVKRLIEQVNRVKDSNKPAYASDLQKLFREYAELRMSKPDLLFSLLLSQALRFPTHLSFLPRVAMWAGTTSFRPEDLEPSKSDDGKIFAPLVEKMAREVGKTVGDLAAQDSSDVQTLRDFSIALIDYAMNKAKVQKPEDLNYRKALLLKDMGDLEKARNLLVSIVQRKRGEYWAWHRLSEVVESSDTASALALCAKACLICRDHKFGIRAFEDLGRLAAVQEDFQLAKWATEQAFTVRSENEWRIPQSLRVLLDADWYAKTISMSDPKKALSLAAAAAEAVIWKSCPKYNANYLGTFPSKSQKEMVKFALVWDGKLQEIVNPARDLLKGVNLAFGDPVTVAVDGSGDFPKIGIVTIREVGYAFDCLSHETGQFRLHPNGFGFVNNTYVPLDLATQIADGSTVVLAVVSRFNKKKNRWEVRAVALPDGEDIRCS